MKEAEIREMLAGFFVPEGKMSSGADSDKIIALLEDEVKYLKAECDRWVRLYEEEAKARRELQQYIRDRWGKEDGK